MLIKIADTIISIVFVITVVWHLVDHDHEHPVENVYPPCEQVSQSEVIDDREVFIVFVCQTEDGHRFYGEYIDLDQ